MRLIFFLLCAATLLTARERASELPEELLYKRLDPLSIREQLSFYHLYPSSPFGQKALAQAWELLQKGPGDKVELSLPPFDLQPILSLITRNSFDPIEKLSEEQLQLVESCGEHLAHRKLLGSRIWTKETLDSLPLQEIDIGRGLLINQFTNAEDAKEKIRQYEALLDLMALQILARLPKEPTPLQKISAINSFIFHEMNFRFPPHSLYAKQIDLFTFLSSVLDRRQGVCLGVSILYLSLAQRLDLSLEIITPPGHIFLRYKDDKRIVNIETTARGVDLPSSTYLGVNTRKLPVRTLREVLGMVFFNHASLAWETQDYRLAATLYEKARLYMEDDPQLRMLHGFSCLFAGNKKEGKELLEKGIPFLFDESVSKETLPEDYLKGDVNLKGIKTIFLPVDNKRESILAKQKKLKKVLQKCPRFREGWYHLAVTYLQLGRESEAFDVLKKHDALDQSNPTVAYYLSVLSLHRLDYNEAWHYLKQAENLTAARHHAPKALRHLKQELKRLSPPDASLSL
ncbi:MAG: hypothetical protein A2Y28_00230 [Chlamydiae bacterium GWC2_50_10]|nr:MAG: hypothetical protein A2Z85_03795 [Chlamydiae bacterium GWA2_50_15]OGN54581.1 MAG: hypothetical protein A2Y28_00230 [Chlamydiae bacterium GWC2_50_10]OGN55785.1 MAG: hypothetical protein A2098_04380 [Chlamydiae bacterium GWF2_49_8]OGN57883.1 MAG: hypothetical protein A3D18_03440 [Chlamydiae bacterium RIFCSPHIGHO2_02_FULL_49_29]OGN63351.1 MAG: hypothetical protein A3E26_00310 [Chlamydiae bacterium RIFCSPHIGHO2_12_FULL_49_32]OGN69678.1 MAG: hypothetical protein A3I15_02190 [Chlamydiae bact